MRRSVVAGALALTVLGPPACAVGARPVSGTAAGLLPVTSITVNGNGGSLVYDGVGAVLGGGGNARYLMDYREPWRSQMLDYLFKPGFGASLQLLKLEIGGGANSSDGSEPSIDPTGKQVRCDAGYEFAIARQAVALNPGIRLYGLQWSAPGWVSEGVRPPSVFTRPDIRYLLEWLGCARKNGLTISYLGGWNESDNGSHASWYGRLRSALDAAGYRDVRIVAADTFAPRSQNPWPYPSAHAVSVLGNHDVCGYPTGNLGPDTACTVTSAARASGKPLWASELGAMDAGAQTGCKVPCAPAMDRATVRGYIDARLTGYLEWPVIDAMPPGLPFENRGLVTADQPWSGHYSVNAMTWAIAQFTHFVSPPSRGGTWRYVDTASGYLQGNRADGSYVTLVRSGGTAWSTIVETTSASAEQQASFTVTGGASGLAGVTVHVRASDFNPGAGPARWFMPLRDITPVNGKFTIRLEPGWVYSLTTTTGQGNATTPTAPGSSSFPLPYNDSMATSGNAGPADNEPQYLAAQDGSFELRPCRGTGVPPAHGAGTGALCTEQTTMPTPVFWGGGTAATTVNYPYATIGDDSLGDYTVSVRVLLTRAGTSAGLIGRFGNRGTGRHIGEFDGYVFDVATSGAWRLIKNFKDAGYKVLAARRLARPLGAGRWHLLSMSLVTTGPGKNARAILTISVDRKPVTSVTDPSSPWRSGLAGIEAGAFTQAWPQAQYRDLSVVRQQQGHTRRLIATGSYQALSSDGVIPGAR
jgi:hypothetical protein